MAVAKGFFRRLLPDIAYLPLRRIYYQRDMQGAWWFLRNDLRGIASCYYADKWDAHWYAQHYQRHFAPFRRKRINLLEIGVGGYDNPRAGGNSLRMWRRFFPKGQIYSIDIHDKSLLEEPRIHIFRGSQADPDFLRWVVKQIGTVDLIVDDGSHVNEHVISSFRTLFPELRKGGIYAIEDMQSSYWPDYGGSEDPQAENTSAALCKEMIDGLNWVEFNDRLPNPLDQDIVGLHVYHSLAFIEKGCNNEARYPARSDQTNAKVTVSTLF